MLFGAANTFAESQTTASLLYELSGTDAADAFGYSVAGGGDVNADGKADFIVGVPFANPEGRINAGQAFVYSGADGSLLYTIDGATAGDRLGGSVGLRGDLNGDGREDFIVGAAYADPGGLTDAGSAYTYSGSDGSLLYQKDGGATGDRLGGSVGIYGDVNADGWADFIIGAAEADPGGLADAGSAYIYSGADGGLIYQKDGGAVGDRLGGSVGISGDVDGDGRGDFIIGAPEADPGGLASAGSVYLYSGTNGSLIFQKSGTTGGNRLGGSVGLTEVTDVNGDSRADIVAGAPGTSSSAGAVFIYSGSDGSLIYQKTGGAAGDRLGGSVGISGDVNNDGSADFIAGAPEADVSGNPDAGNVFVYSGTTGSLLYQKSGSGAADRLGGSVGIMGDATADGYAEFMAGAPVAKQVGASVGLAYVYSGATGNLLYNKNGTASGEFFGNAVSGAGDVNGDGIPDFIIGSVRANPGGLTEAGSAYVYSGANGALLYRKDGAAAGDHLGVSVASAGDVNGDGRPDFVVGAARVNNFAGSAYVYSGATGTLLFQKDGAAAGDYLGYSVVSAGDVNGDGKAEFIIGAYGADPDGISSAGSAYVYSGADGSLIYQKNGGAPNDELGFSVAGAGDVNGDGKADFITGAIGVSFHGSVYIYSGETGALLYTKDGASGNELGSSVAGVGDVSGDGKADFIIGAPSADRGSLSSCGSAYVFSGANGALLYRKDGGVAAKQLGISVAGAGDFDGDGRADFIIGGAGPGDFFTGSAYVYSGATGTLLFQKDGGVSGDEFGTSVAGVGDVNGDGKADFIGGAFLASPGGLVNAGSAYVYGLPLPCAAAKGDMNASGGLSPADVVLMLNCVFLRTGDCGSCFADVNCSGGLSPADVVIELQMVYLAALPPC